STKDGRQHWGHTRNGRLPPNAQVRHSIATSTGGFLQVSTEELRSNPRRVSACRMSKRGNDWLSSRPRALCPPEPMPPIAASLLPKSQTYNQVLTKSVTNN